MMEAQKLETTSKESRSSPNTATGGGGGGSGILGGSSRAVVFSGLAWILRIVVWIMIITTPCLSTSEINENEMKFLCLSRTS